MTKYGYRIRGRRCKPPPPASPPRIAEDATELIGNTPLVRLSRFGAGTPGPSWPSWKRLRLVTRSRIVSVCP